MNTKNWTRGIILLALLAVSACSSSGGASQATPAASSIAPIKATDKIIADATVTPVRWASLSFQVGGVVAAVNAPEGGAVKAGDVLVQLDDADAKLAVAQAEAALALAQAQLAQLRAGPQPEQVAVAEQGVKAAQAGVWGASAQLAKLQAGATAADIAAAEAAVAQAAAQLKVAQDQHDQTLKCYDVTKPDGSKDQVCPTLGTIEEQARAAWEAAQENYAAAQQRLKQLKAGATKNDLDAARANVAAAQASQVQAQAQLDLLKAGATQTQIAVSEAGVQQAQVVVDMAKAQLSKLQLVAPFDGTVVSLGPKPGELVSPGVPVVQLADLSAWQIETDDLTELNIVRVGEGSAVDITFDAIPGLELTGKVVRIKALGENKQGDITYTVIIQPDQQDERLRWNMTASVAIEPK